jgi:copper(I)-binding protein
MLMDLKAPLADKSSVPVTLTFENAKGVKSQVELQVPVKSMNMQSQHKH